MKWGSRNFSLIDLIGDAVVTTWQGRQAIDWTIITRRLIKLAGLVLVTITLCYVLYPTQKRSWLLWLGEDERTLAHWTAVSIVGFTAIILALGKYAWERHKALGVAGIVAAAVTIATAIMGQWNYYSYASGRAVSVSESATGGAQARIAEAERRLASLDAEMKAQQATFAEDIRRMPASYVTARSRVMAQQNEALAQARNERTALQQELQAARSANTDVALTVADPRPIDRFIAGCWQPGPCVNRSAAATALDLQRSALFEFICLIGVTLCTTYAGIRTTEPRESVIYKYGHQPLGDDRAIEDQRAKPKIRRGPYVATKERIFDAETGEEIVKVPGYTRRKGKSKSGDPQPATIETPPISLPDETGVQLERDSRVARGPLWDNASEPQPHVQDDFLQPDNPQALSEHSQGEQSESSGQDDVSGRDLHEEVSLFGEYDDHQNHHEPSAEREEEQQRQLAHGDDLTDEEWAALADEEELERA